MNSTFKQSVVNKSPVAAAAFFALSLLLLPISLLGYVIWVGKILTTGRVEGVSTTAQGPLSARWFEHNLGTREDEAANRLLTALPGVPKLGMWLAAAPTLLAHRLTGFVPRAFRYPFEGEVPEQYEASARIDFFDSTVNRCLSYLTQFVILGAGFDTRAYRLPKEWNIRSFEIDVAKTQAVKRQMLEKVNVDTSGVAFVAADFEKDDWLAKLAESGFDLGKPALFLWEGVTMYLDRQAVEATLRKIGSTAKGSVVAFDYFTSETLTSKSLYWWYGRATTTAAGEPLKFGIDSTPPVRERTAEFLAACGLSLAEHRTLGKDTEARRAWGGFATATVK